MLSKIQITMPSNVTFIIETIQAAGYEAYAVGGCVRDKVRNLEPADWDITTSAKPEVIKTLFRRTIDTGIQHGTVTIMIGPESFEVTTYRIDGEYEDSRHPREVTFTSNLTEDLKRRDFTINAMAYNDQEGLIDVFDGMKDIDKGIIRCVGNPQERFSEDALRMMRAVRFSAQLGYEIEPETRAAIVRLAADLQKISAERIQAELVKLLVSPHPDYLRLAYETGITREILPEFDLCMEIGQNNPHHCYTVGEHLLHSMLEAEPDKVLRLTMLFHDIAKPVTRTADPDGIDHFHNHPELGEEMTKNILYRLKFDNDTLYRVSVLVRYHDYKIITEPRYVRRAIHKIGEELFSLFLKVQSADAAAQSDYRREEKLAYQKKLEEVYRQILLNKDCVSLKTLAINGKDLINAGMTPGKQMGDVLQKLLEDVIECPEHNNKEYLLQAALSM